MKNVYVFAIQKIPKTKENTNSPLDLINLNEKVIFILKFLLKL